MTDAMPAAETLPPLDRSARAAEARGQHHRQIVRRTILAVVILAISAAIIIVGSLVTEQLKVVTALRADGFRIEWSLDWYDSTPKLRSIAIDTWDFWRDPSTKPDLTRLALLRNLEELRIDDSRLSARELAPISAIKDLRSLNFSRASLLVYNRLGEPWGDDCLLSVVALSRLESLDLTANAITDAGLERIAGLSGLETLILDGTDVTDAGLGSLRRFANLKHVSLGATRVTREAAAALQAQRPDLDINLDASPELERMIRERRAQRR